ncbi:NepR family anti-sigma factor [Microvirga massiliensis]|uniref:NepR family anti-sigma factor n=1 Tax=Microvirga massiliensis TaxID=1033741 RepID=UPI00062B5AF0|nr:NepR family anti-sigma factor [Microvirga massiliensis]
MNFYKGGPWNLGGRPQWLRQGQTLDLLGRSLRQVYAEPEPLPDRLRELVARLEAAESESLRASRR